MEKLTSPSQYVQATLLKHLKTIHQQIPGVRRPTTIEPLHQVRVALRRLRNGLWVVEHLFPSQKLKQWNKKIRLLAIVLGQARDLDVYIEFLVSLKRETNDSEDKNFIKRLLIDFYRQRKKIQPKLLLAFKKIEREKTFAYIEQYLYHLSQSSKKEDIAILYPMARQRIIKRLKKFLSFKKYVNHPECVDELHQMRIAVKQLRYTLETFEPLFGQKIKSFVVITRNVQGLLGQLHDYDVWLEIFLQYVKLKKNKEVQAAGHLSKKLKGLRAQTYIKFRNYWKWCGRRKVWGNLKKYLREENRKRPLRMAIISDVHGNWRALKAVLGHAQKKNIQTIWHLGDFVGYGPWPNEVIETIRESRIDSIIGNYDLKVLDFAKNRRAWQKSKHPVKYFSFAWTHKNLKKGNANYLRGLPSKMLNFFGGKRFLLVHGSPVAIDEPLTKDTPTKRFRKLAKRVKEDIVLCGHSHEFFVRKIAGVTFINPGSAGHPLDGDRRASYVIVEMKNDKLKVKNYRLKYNLQPTLKRMRAKRFPEELVRSLDEARSIEDLD